MKTKNNTQFTQLVEIPQPLEVHPSVSPKAAALLEGVIEILMREPSRYNQMQEFPSSCKSPCCILGHMRQVAGVSATLAEHGDVNLTYQQQERLLHFADWPASCKELGYEALKAKFGENYWLLPTSENLPASVGIDRIEHFLRTGE